MPKFQRCILTVLLLAIPVARASDVTVIADFEEDSYQGWKTEGEAFGTGPVKGTLDGQMTVSGFQGIKLVNSFLGGDGPTGKLVSDPFVIQRPYITFLIGGGKYPGETCMNLIADGKVVRTATGPNDKPGGTEALQWTSWDVSELQDRQVHLEIVDARSGGWGHINVDYICQSDQADPPVNHQSKTFTASKPYLILPQRNDAPSHVFSVEVDGKVERMFTVGLANGRPHFWVYLGLDAFQGKTVTVATERFAYEGSISDGFDEIRQSDTVPGFENLYHETYRPQFHFSSRRGWNNDPNGLVYYKGEWHLFYQHNPFGWNWGNMTWGHAVSTDLVHWTELGDAIHPDELGTIFSGSAVVDVHNTTGFKTGSEDPIVAAYTSAGGTNPFWSDGQPFTQSIAYSNDRGRTWTKYAGNPVQPHIQGSNRDPKMIWHEPSQQWVIVLYLDKKRIGFFTSKDLKSWHLQSELEGFYECPELFELPVDGDKDNMKWVVYGGSGDYMIGEFDGTAFHPESELIRYSYGDCFYASQTYNNVPKDDGRRIQIGWGRVRIRTMPFNQMMTFPVELTLHTTNEGIRMFAYPVREIETLHTTKHHWENQAIVPGENPLADVHGELFDIDAEIDVSDAEKVELNVRGIPIAYDVAASKLTCQNLEAPLQTDHDRIRLRILVDRTSIEIYANDGRVYFPVGAILDPENTSLSLDAVGTGAQIADLNVYEMQSAWPSPN